MIKFPLKCKLRFIDLLLFYSDHILIILFYIMKFNYKTYDYLLHY